MDVENGEWKAFSHLRAYKKSAVVGVCGEIGFGGYERSAFSLFVCLFVCGDEGFQFRWGGGEG